MTMDPTNRKTAQKGTALITGITGQDGSYLAELLLSKGYAVHGLVRRSSSIARSRIDPLFYNEDIYNQSLFLHYAELDDVTAIRRILIATRPDEMYHLAGQSHVGVSFDNPESTCQFTAMGTLKLLEILRDLEKQPKFLHIGSSEIFGRPDTSPQNEQTPIRPITPYGIAKAFGTQMVALYRETHGMFACNAICYNHESPRRGESFVTRKISKAVAAISVGSQDRLKLGSIDGQRDWGYAPEYVDAMWRMLQQPSPMDVILATGQSDTVKNFLVAAFSAVGLDWQRYVDLDQRYIRPAEVARLVGDPTKADAVLDWRAETKLPELAQMMVKADLALLQSKQ